MKTEITHNIVLKFSLLQFYDYCHFKCNFITDYYEINQIYDREVNQ